LATEVTHDEGIRPSVYSFGNDTNPKALGQIVNFLAYKSLSFVSGTATYEGGINFEFDEWHLPDLA
jgi:hypothetical protein